MFWRGGRGGERGGRGGERGVGEERGVVGEERGVVGEERGVVGEERGACIEEDVAFIHFMLQIIILIGGIPILWSLAGSMMGQYGYGQEYEVCNTLCVLNVTWDSHVTCMCITCSLHMTRM